MKRALTTLVTLLVTAASVAHADNFIQATIPIFSQKVGFKMEQGWRTGDQQANASVFLLELVPGGENINSWSRMLTVEGFRGLSSKMSIDAAFKTEADSVVQACPGNSVKKLLPIKNPQGYDSVVAIVGCLKHPTLKDRNEVALYNFIKGKSDIYMIKKSFHESLSDKQAQHLSEANYKELAGEVLEVKLCVNDGQGPGCDLESP